MNPTENVSARYCRVCGSADRTNHCLREMMFGTRHEFEYAECRKCGFIQIVNVPKNLAEYYPPDYYSFSASVPAWKAWAMWAYATAVRLSPLPVRGGGEFRSVLLARPAKAARTLDVGCGSDKLVRLLRSIGLQAQGIDPFVKTETDLVRRAYLHELQGGWDLIMFHHSLEHMEDQIGVLRCVREKLRPGGTCLVRLPVATWAWQHYGRDWVQLDAPRHLSIHTLKSFHRAADQAGLKVVKVVFDSNEFQFVGSECYKRDVPMNERRKVPFSKIELRSFRKRAAELNRQHLGDQAAFFLTAAE